MSAQERAQQQLSQLDKEVCPYLLHMAENCRVVTAPMSAHIMGSIAMFMHPS